MTNAERIAQLRSKINAKLGTAVTDNNKDVASTLGRWVDKAEELVTTKSVNAYERFQLGRLTHKANRLGA